MDGTIGGRRCGIGAGGDVGLGEFVAKEEYAAGEGAGAFFAEI